MASTSFSRVVTSDDFSSIPKVISWFVGVTEILFVAAKILSRLVLSGQIGLHDLAILMSLICGIGMVISIPIAADHGLGRHQVSLTPTAIRSLEKSVYASDALYIVSLFFSKVSILILLHALMPAKKHAILIWTIGIALIVWTLSSFFASIFQCRVPKVWMILDSHCIDQDAFWLYYGVLNIVTEILLTATPVMVMRKVHMPRAKKTTVILMFTLRVFLLAPIIAEIYVRQVSTSNRHDRTFSLWKASVCMQFVQCLSIVFACVPFLKPFFAALETGMIRVDDLYRLSGKTVYGYRPSHSGKRHERRSFLGIQMARLNQDADEAAQGLHSGPDSEACLASREEMVAEERVTSNSVSPST